VKGKRSFSLCDNGKHKLYQPKSALGQRFDEEMLEAHDRRCPIHNNSRDYRSKVRDARPHNPESMNGGFS
jgi:hypothetical protein